MSLAYHFTERCYVRIGSFVCETSALPKIVKSGSISSSFLFIKCLLYTVKTQIKRPRFKSVSREIWKWLLLILNWVTVIKRHFVEKPKIKRISGLLTYVAAQADEAGVGFGIACAIGLHNIPEGFAVAMPIFIGTKSRSRAMFYGEHFQVFFSLLRISRFCYSSTNYRTFLMEI